MEINLKGSEKTEVLICCKINFSGKPEFRDSTKNVWLILPIDNLVTEMLLGLLEKLDAILLSWTKMSIFFNLTYTIAKQAMIS